MSWSCIPRWCWSSTPPTDLQITVHPAEDGGRRSFTVHSRTGDEHDPGGLDFARQRRFKRRAAPGAGVLADAGYRDRRPGQFLSSDLAEQGFRYSGPFRSVRGIGHHPDRPDVVFAEVELPADTDVTGYGIHPALLDAALQPLAAAFYGTASDADLRRLGFRLRSAGSACTPSRRPGCMSS